MICRTVLLVIISAFCCSEVLAQENTNPTDQGRDSERTEASEDDHRRRMELEGARDRDTFSNTTYTAQADQEKIDKLPKESQDNIRAQLMDMIIENGQWEPFDALRQYPFEPSEVAKKEPSLLEREEEAWAEQIEKYHQREATAYEARRSPKPGADTRQAGADPGSNGQQNQEQNTQGDSRNGEQPQGEGLNGQDESQNSGQHGSRINSSSASSYEPYQSRQSDDSDEISTAGVSQNALDFLKARQGSLSGDQASDSPEDSTAASQRNSPDSQRKSEFIIPGTIAIEDLDKLEGTQGPAEEDPG